jgi:hypothetical protein
MRWQQIWTLLLNGAGAGSNKRASADVAHLTARSWHLLLLPLLATYDSAACRQTSMLLQHHRLQGILCVAVAMAYCKGPC